MPEGTVDVIPVDIVVAAIIGVAAAGPERAPAITQVASGGVNPLKYRAMIDYISGWFTEHPLYDPEGQPILVPEWNFPGRGKVESQLNRAMNVLTRTEKVLNVLPLRGRQAEFTATLEDKRTEIETAKQYVELYGLYTECEAIYQVDNLLGALGLARRRRPRRVQLRSPGRRLGALRHPDPPALDRAARPGQVDARQVAQRRSVDASAQAGPRPQAAGRGVRPGEHADRLERRRELLVPRHPPPQRAGTCPLRHAHAQRGTRRC